MSTFLFVITLSTQSLLTQDVPLQIGDPAPALAVGEFVVGEPVDRLSPGTVYVIEFSGTSCVPCIELIPHLNVLQERHPEVVLISVFPEAADVVRTFFQRLDQKIEYRVSIDNETKMWNHWSNPACQLAIPHAFIVGADGRIAWIGHPGLIDEPLAEIVKGTFNPGKDIQRLALEQGVVIAERQRQERSSRRRQEYHRLNQLAIRGEFTAALSGTRQAIEEYADSDEDVEWFRAMEVYLLVRVPAEEASVLSRSQHYAIQSRLSGDVMVMYRCAAALVNAAGPEPPCRNQSLLDLAEAVLQTETYVEPMRKPNASGRLLRLWTAQVQSQIFYLEGNTQRAFELIKDTVAELESFEMELPSEERRLMTPENRTEAERLMKKYSGPSSP